MQEEALKLASHITHPVTVAAFALVFAATAFGLALKSKKPRIAWLMAAAIIVLGLAPLATSTFLQSRGVYRVRVIVLGPDRQPVSDADVTSSVGGEVKKGNGSWELDIPPQTRPADGRVRLFASITDAFLTGKGTLILADDYYPTVSIEMTSDTSATVRGVVVDEKRRSVAGAHVSILGYEEEAVTKETGNFVLSAHVAEGQMVEIRAQKGDLVADVSVPAGRVPIELILRRH
jgi:hypothetical protein